MVDVCIHRLYTQPWASCAMLSYPVAFKTMVRSVEASSLAGLTGAVGRAIQRHPEEKSLCAVVEYGEWYDDSSGKICRHFCRHHHEHEHLERWAF